MVDRVTGLFTADRVELHHCRVLLLLVQREVGRGHLNNSSLRVSRESQITLGLRDLFLGRVEAEVVVGAPLTLEGHRAEFSS